ncbi:MAG: hypothetical protein ACREUU_08275 [Gammaproteobacteria bacterium]
MDTQNLSELLRQMATDASRLSTRFQRISQTAGRSHDAAVLATAQAAAGALQQASAAAAEIEPAGSAEGRP